MKTEKIKKIINALKQDSDIFSLFWDRIAYSAFFCDLEEKGLLIQPLFNKKKDCYTETIVQFQIIDGKIPTSRIKLREEMEILENFLNSRLKNFAWFETIAVESEWDEVILQNNKNRLVFVKRFNFYF